MLTSVTPRSSKRWTRATFAMLLAVVLVWVSGLGLGLRPASLTSFADHGLAGATAERAEFGSLPSGKQTNEAIGEEVVEAETEKEMLAAAAIGHAHLEEATFAIVRLEIERSVTIRIRRSIAAVGARGPPLV